ncbi:MAG: hypothetical protein H0T97_03865 [Actinobacteria bacterium]|nr:hypothetical protein [Actinomycetota bacterium]
MPVTPNPLSPYRRVHVLSALVALALGAFVALTLPGTAMATPCGDAVLADWFDNGRVDRLYQAHCYEEAIDAIPKDLEDYTNAQEIIGRALQFSLRDKLAPGGKDPTPGDGGVINHPPDDPGDPGGPGSDAAPEVDTTGISSIPIPLLVLGGMSIALLGAGGLGYLSRRRAAAREDGTLGPDDDLLT